MTEKVKKVDCTPAAREVIIKLKEEHGELMFHQSGGCCDGSSPMCYPQGDLMLGDGDVYLGDIESCPFYISSFQYEYWKHTQLLIDVSEGRGASFSLEIPLGLRFITKSKVFTEGELQELGFLKTSN